MKKLTFSFYLCWILPALVAYFIPLPANIGTFQHNLIHLIFIALYLLLASSLSYGVIRQVIRQDSPIVIPYAIGSVGLFALIYICVVYFEVNLLLVSAVSTANLLFCASLLGTILSSAVKRPGELVPVSLTAAVADVVSVLKGPTKSMVEDITSYYDKGLEGVPPLVDFILIKATIPGYYIPLPLFGVTDWILIVLLSSSLLRMHMNDNLLDKRDTRNTILYLPVSVVALYVCLVFAQISQQFIPAMLFITLFFLSYLIVKFRVYKKLHKVDYVYSLFFPGLVAASIFIFVQ